jgi:hypothetical protein
MKFTFVSTFRISVKKFKFNCNMTRITGALHEDQYICIYIHRVTIKEIDTFTICVVA